MVQPVCLKLKDYKDRYICNQKYVDIIRKCKDKHLGSYEVFINDTIQNMRDLIIQGLTYNYDIEIPDGYSVTKLYHIVFSSGNFEPNDRNHTSVRSSITFTTKSKSQVKKMFERMCKTIGRKPIYKDKFNFCWQTDDFAYNQVTNTYSITESYLVEEVKCSDYKEEILKLVKDIKGFCRNDVLYDLVDKIERLYNEKE